MPLEDYLAALKEQDWRRDKKVVLRAVVKHIEQESLRVKSSSPFEERDLTPLNVFRLFRDYIVRK